MPYKSKAQQRKFHALEAQGKISPQVVQEFDQATQGEYGTLPERVPRKKVTRKKR